MEKIGEKKFICCICKEEFTKKEIKKVPSGMYCKNCYKEKRSNHIEHLKRDILGIRKRKDLEKEWAKKREEKKQKLELPIVNGSKLKKQKKKTISKSSYLTLTEKQFLFSKYIKKGLDYDEADKMVRRDTTYLREFIEKLKQENKQKQEKIDISKKFKEEFAKLLENRK